MISSQLDPPPMTQLPRSSPEAQGVSSQAISSFLDTIAEQGLELHSLMLVRHGQVIAEGWWNPYSSAGVHLLYSLSKSFTATAVGMVSEEGLLSLDDNVISFFPEETPSNASEHLRAIQVKHLLSMATGHAEDTIERVAKSDEWVRNFLAIPPDEAPGTIFCYNNGSTFMLAAILAKVTDVSLLEYLRPRLLEPLGIDQARWHENPQGIQLGFTGLHVTTESIAKFGQLYLQKGEWQGQQLISKTWIEEATRPHIASASPGQEEGKFDWQQGYGFQFWMCRHGAYRGDGAFGQFCVVMPEQDAVFVATSGEEDMQAILDAVWNHLLPAMRAKTLTVNDDAQQHLQRKLKTLAYEPIQGDLETTLSASAYKKKYEFEDVTLDIETAQTFGWLVPKSLTLEQKEIDQKHWLLTLSAKETFEVKAGYGQWNFHKAKFHSGDLENAASSGAWTKPDTLTLQVRYVETPHCLTFNLQFAGNEVKLGLSWNVAFGPLEAPPLVGKAGRKPTIV